MKVVAFVPIKMNNERVPGKNTRKFRDGTPLIHCILKQLKNVNEISEVYVYCSKEEIQEYLPEGVGYVKRPEMYDTADANVNEMFYSFAKQIPADIYVLAHATCPFTASNSISKGIKAVMSGAFDSAVAVKKVQDFMWQDGKPVNYELQNIPRTQDLKPFFMETTGLYIFDKEVIMILKRRIGNNPYLLEVTEIEAIDIDEEEDFMIADAIYSAKAHMISRRGGTKVTVFSKTTSRKEVA